MQIFNKTDSDFLRARAQKISFKITTVKTGCLERHFQGMQGYNSDLKVNKLVVEIAYVKHWLLIQGEICKIQDLMFVNVGRIFLEARI